MRPAAARLGGRRAASTGARSTLGGRPALVECDAAQQVERPGQLIVLRCRPDRRLRRPASSAAALARLASWSFAGGPADRPRAARRCRRGARRWPDGPRCRARCPWPGSRCRRACSSAPWSGRMAPLPEIGMIVWTEPLPNDCGAHDDRASLVLQRAGDDLRGRRRAAVDQHDHGQVVDHVAGPRR